MASEDFTFPTIADTLPCTLDSPPLWRRLSSTADEGGGDGEDDDHHDKDCFPETSTNSSQRKSLSYLERDEKMAKKGGSDTDQGREEEEKMDMLWEDLNEELSSSSRSDNTDHSSSREMGELGGCVQALKLSKTGALSTRKPSIVVIVKVLKKLFLLHNNHHRSQKRQFFS